MNDFALYRLNAQFKFFVVVTCMVFVVACRHAPSIEPIQEKIEVEQELVIQVDPDQTFQTVENFGVSGAWWAQEVGGWQPDNRQRVINLLFDTQNGIGLSAYRYNIGAGSGGEIQDPWRNTDGFEISPGIYDWNRDAEAIRILKMVKSAGVTQFIAFANSPPARLTRSGMVTGSVDGSSNLGLLQEAAYARYLIDIVAHLQKDEGIPIGWISPVNEPQWDWNLTKNQEGCHYSPEELVNLVNELNKAITINGITVKILTPESGQWVGSLDYLEPLLGNPQITLGLNYASIHSYWSTSQEKESIARYLRKNYPEMHVWMTEWTEMENGRDTGIESAITLATTIHDDLTLAGVNAWQYWIAVSKYDFSDGLLYVSPGSQITIETKRLWAFGNYSRFIRPGSRLILAQVNSTSLQVSAFKNPEGNSVIIVVINPQSGLQSAKLIVKGNWVVLSAFETSHEYDLQKVYAGTILRLM